MIVMGKKKGNKFWKGFREERILVKGWWEQQLAQPLWGTVWRLLKKLKIELSHDPVISLLSIYPKELKAGFWKDTCILVFIAALFTIAKMWKQRNCQPMD